MGVRLVVKHPGTPEGAAEEVRFELDQPRIAVGRSPGADVRLPDARVSHLHMVIERVQGRFVARDEGSTNGTEVNGQLLVVGRNRSLDDGDELTVGPFSVSFEQGPLLGPPTSRERTASLAKRLLREMLAPTDTAAAPMSLVLQPPDPSGARLTLPPPPCRLRVGRDAQADWVLSDPEVSGEHMQVERDLDGVCVRDMDSKNGVLVNGRPVVEQRLRDGDQIRLGDSLLEFMDPAEHGLRELEQVQDRPVERTATAVTPPAPEPKPAQRPAARPTPVAPERAVVAPALRRPALTAPDSLGADAVIYVMAAVVLATSLAGLAWLLG